ncbi:MAG: PIN domain-containing protein [Chthoniobacterales bacterium]
MELVVADSSFYIRALRSRRQPFLEMERLAERVEWATTGMIMLEVCRGLRDPKVRDDFEMRYSTMVYLPTTNSVWEQAVRLAWTLDRKGYPIPAQDIVIAAACQSQGAHLLTHDQHFSQIPGLEVAHSLADL